MRRCFRTKTVSLTLTSSNKTRQKVIAFNSVINLT